MIQFLFGPGIGRRALRQHRPDGLKKRHVVADADRVFVGDGEREGLGKFPHRLHATIFTVLLRQHVLLCGGQQAQPFRRRAGQPLGPVEAVEQAAADFVLFLHDRHRFRLIDRGLARAAALRVRRQRALEFVGKAQVIDDETARLVLEHAVDPGDGLHQSMTAHRFVHVHGVQTRRVEAGEPHVAHQHHAQRIGGVAEPVRHGLAPGLVADVRLPVGRV